MATREITLSVVSHGQNALVNLLLEDVQRFCAERVSLVITENIPDPTPLAAGAFDLIENDRAKGFGANHNAAFKYCRTPWFCVCNPDIRLTADPFPSLLEVFSDPGVGVAGPLVKNPSGQIEDSARRFPTVASLVQKAFREKREPDYPTDRGPVAVDWVAGMFMLFRRDVFEAVKGFDEAYFLYYEDVDLCRRLSGTGRKVFFNPQSEVIHDARRASRRDARLALHHMHSMLRFLSRG